jgi:sugar (pentulose or hexulose) kinase
MTERAYFIGIDLGSQGLRVVVTDQRGELVSSSETSLKLTDDLRREQDTTEWWLLCLACLVEAVSPLEAAVRKEIRAIGVTSTSGTVIPLDKDLLPLHPAIMYSDDRSSEQAERCTLEARKAIVSGFTNFNRSTGLAKMVWFTENYPELVPAIRRWIHAADFLTGRLSGEYGVTDYTNVLKSGYNLNDLCWPSYLFDQLPLKRDWMQKVVPSGTVIGSLLPELTQRLGLSDRVAVIVGITDGCASQVASGAMRPGQWNTTIGTTLVVKGVTEKPVEDALGRLYNHRHPQGYWMPGGAANIGADWVAREYPEDYAEMSELAENLIPTGKIAYPLLQAGERFPFIAPQARGFAPEGLSREEAFAAKMEGVAYVERYAYEMIEALSNETVEAVYTAGGGSSSDLWLRIRSSVLNKPVYKTRHGSGALGAAIVSASQTFYSSLAEAASFMVQHEKIILPEPLLVEAYRGGYERFLEVLRRKSCL